MSPKIAKWRYKRGTRILADSFGKNVPQNGFSDNNVNTEDKEEEYEIPDEIEDVLEILFRGSDRNFNSGHIP